MADELSMAPSEIGVCADHESKSGVTLSLDDILREAFKRFRPTLVALTSVNHGNGRHIVSQFHCADGVEPAEAIFDQIICIGQQATQVDGLIKGQIASNDVSSVFEDSARKGSGLSSYFAMPIKIENGKAVGAFCILTGSRRRFSKEQFRSLEFMVRACSSHLELKARRDEVVKLRQQEVALSAHNFVSEKKFNDLARNVPGAIFEYTMRPGLPDKIEFMSPGCYAIWGYHPEELEGDPTLLWDAILDDDLADMKASILRSAEDLTHWQHRWRIRTKSGLIKWLQSFGTPFRLSNGGTRWNTLILDVSVEQTAQLALVENTRLIHQTQKINSVGRIAGGVAHDFNNILAIINGNAESIATDSLSSEDRVAIEEIISASVRGVHLTKQLLGFAMRTELRPENINLSSAIANVGSMLKRVLPANISLETSLTAGLWMAHIDRSLLENALLNLVINARDAMPQGGELTIETANVRIDKDYIEVRDENIPPGRYVMIAITDTGTGIDEALLPRLFEPFFTTKGPNDGTGLGLAMVDGFVRQSGGAVRIYSEVGHGTSVKLYFPAIAGEFETDRSPEPRASSSLNTPVRILLVEDQDAVRLIIEKTLRSAGHKVVSASLGDKAWDIFEREPDGFDLVVTDVVMPGKLQGPQLVRAMRQVRRDIPVLYMSGYPHEANVHGNGVRETDISLMKPVRRGELLTAVDRLCRLI